MGYLKKKIKNSDLVCLPTYMLTILYGGDRCTYKWLES